jgi:GDP-D-mannose 3', 5'-epimerase
VKTVVTGGAGFIGSHLVRKLLDCGREVTVASDFSRGSTGNLSHLGIRPEDLGYKKTYPVIDLRDYTQCRRIIEGTGTVFHLAARIGGINYLHGTNYSELEALQTNLVIDTNVFRACQESHTTTLVYASSAAVYPIDLQQSSDVILAEETLSYFNPDGGYGWAKLMGEIQLRWMTDIRISMARIFNVYGENSVLEGSSHVIIDLMRKAIRYPQEEFNVWGDGKQSRDFLHVSDCVNALLKLEEKASNPPVTVNVGSGETTEIGALARRIVSISGKDIPIAFDPRKPVGPVSRTAKMALAKNLLDWQPQVSLDEGLERTYRWLRQELQLEGGH